MHFGRKLIPLAVCVLCLALASCGGGSSSGTSPDPSGGGKSAEFLDPHNPALNEKVVELGKEGSKAELAEANSVVQKNLRAREEGDFAAQCATLNYGTTKGLVPINGAKGGCAAGLKSFAEPLAKTKAARKDTLSGSISVLRVKGKLGYALYHGNDGKDRGLLMEKEDGHWKVASLLTFEL